MEVWGGNRHVDGGVVMAGLDAWIYSRPYGDAAEGGDVHYVSSCATGRITRMLVADVSGHGEAVSKPAVALRTLMRRFVNYLDQTRFVAELNGQFTALAQQGQFATSVVTTFFSPTNDLTVCNAGHPPPLLFSAAARRWTVLDPATHAEVVRKPCVFRVLRPRRQTAMQPEPAAGAANIPLGIVDEISYEQFGLRLAVGDCVLCYTDSLIEAHGADGQMLGVDGLLRVVQALDMSDPATLIPSLLTALETLAEGNLVGDDVTLLLFRPNGLGARPSFLKRALAPIRILFAAMASLRRGGEPAAWPDFSLPNVGGAVAPSLSKGWTQKNAGPPREPPGPAAPRTP